MARFISPSRSGLFAFVLLSGFFQLSRCYAADARTFLIAVASGYGVEDCLGESGECGKAVADAWCEAQGHGSALAFGRSEDGPKISSGTGAPDHYFVTCGD
jgi:hypothetical protein